jgi:hypothetical protein
MVAHFLFCSLRVATFTQTAGETSPSVLSHILESFSVQKENMMEEQKDRVIWTAGSAFTGMSRIE